MKRLLFVVLLLSVAAPAHAAIAIVQANGSGADSSSNATSTGVDTSGATLLVMSCSWLSGASITASDNKSNTWTPLTQQTGGVAVFQIFYVNSASPTVGAAHTFACDGTDSYPVVAFIAASGTHATPFDQQGGNSTASASSLAAGSVTPTQDNEIVIVGITIDSGTTLTINGGFTTAFTYDFMGGTSMGGGLAYLIQTTATSANPTWSWSGTAAAATASSSFKAAAAGGGGNCGRALLLGAGGC